MNTKKILGVVAVLALVAVAMVGAGAADPTGQGTQDDPWIISDETDLTYAFTNAASEGSYAKLSDGLTNSITTDNGFTLAVGKKLELDLNGKTIESNASTSASANPHTITNKGTLTIKDSSENKTGTIKRNDTSATKANYVILNEASATMNIQSATVTNGSGTATKSGASLICNKGTMTIDNLLFEQAKFIAVKNDEGGDLTINGGTFRTDGVVDDRVYSALLNYGTAIVNDGTFEGAITAGHAEKAGATSSLTIKGGTFNNCAIAFFEYDGVDTSNTFELIIQGGTFNISKIFNWNYDAAPITTWREPTFNITGGSFTVADADTMNTILTHATSATVNMNYDLTVADHKTVTVPKGVTLTVPSSKTLTVGQNAAGKAEVVVDGILTLGGGSLNVVSTDTVYVNGSIVAEDLSKITGTVDLQSGSVMTVTDTGADLAAVGEKIATADKGSVIKIITNTTTGEGTQYSVNEKASGSELTESGKTTATAISAGSGTTVVGLVQAVEYTFVIQDSVSLSSSAVAYPYSITITKAGDSADNRNVVMRLTAAANNATGAEKTVFKVTNAVGSASVEYGMTVDSVARGLLSTNNNIVTASVHATKDVPVSKDLTFTGATASVAGNYSDTLTFTVGVEGTIGE